MIPMKRINTQKPPILEAFDDSISDWVCISMFKGMPGGTDSEAAEVEDLLVAEGEDSLAAAVVDWWGSVGLVVE